MNKILENDLCPLPKSQAFFFNLIIKPLISQFGGLQIKNIIILSLISVVPNMISLHLGPQVDQFPGSNDLRHAAFKSI